MCDVEVMRVKNEAAGRLTMKKVSLFENVLGYHLYSEDLHERRFNKSVREISE